MKGKPKKFPKQNQKAPGSQSCDYYIECSLREKTKRLLIS
jgi:hypothetical protein